MSTKLWTTPQVHALNALAMVCDARQASDVDPDIAIIAEIMKLVSFLPLPEYNLKYQEAYLKLSIFFLPKLATLKTSGTLSRVCFRKDYWDRYRACQS